MFYKQDLNSRFWSKVLKTDSCWEWQAYRDEHGYGRFQIGHKWRPAHRCSYELIKGEIPPTLLLDHLCENKGCVNPNHLEPVTSRINSLRGRKTLAHRNSSKTHCPKGHPYSDHNLIIANNGHNGARRCRTCKNALERIRDHANRRRDRAKKNDSEILKSKIN